MHPTAVFSWVNAAIKLVLLEFSFIHIMWFGFGFFLLVCFFVVVFKISSVVEGVFFFTVPEL